MLYIHAMSVYFPTSSPPCLYSLRLSFCKRLPVCLASVCTHCAIFLPPCLPPEITLRQWGIVVYLTDWGLHFRKLVAYRGHITPSQTGERQRRTDRGSDSLLYTHRHAKHLLYYLVTTSYHLIYTLTSINVLFLRVCVCVCVCVCVGRYMYMFSY